MEYFHEPILYAVKHCDETVRASSRSGGVFTAISDLFLDNGGVVYGCVLDEKFHAKHIRSDSKDSRDQMRGSKYIQSNLSDCFAKVKRDLKEGREILFSGTSCQIAGLQSYLKYAGEQGNSTGRILFVDILCHGVPSSAIWDAFIRYQEKKNNGKCVAVDFRNKKDFGWQDHVETLWIKNRFRTKRVHSNLYKRIFYSHLALRPACHVCPYKNIIHPGDITIADYWGIDEAAPGFNDDKGVSLVLINSTNGRDVFCEIADTLDIRKTNLENSMQPPLIAPFARPKERDDFWKDFYAYGIKYVEKKYFFPDFKSFLLNVLRIKSHLIKTKMRNNIE